MARYLYYFSDFDSFRYHFNRSYKLQLDSKFVGLSGLVARLGEKAFCLFRRAFERALRCANSALSRLGVCVFNICGHKLKVNLW